MITARQLKGGFIIELDKCLYLVMATQHIKPGKGGAFVRAKMKNLRNGSIIEKTLRPQDSFHQAFIEEKKMQYLYKDHSSYHFMNQVTYEQLAVSKDLIGENSAFLKDGMEVTASFHADSIIAVTLPSFVELKIEYTEPGIRGDTARGGSKPATLETGAVVRVPLFINTGNIIRIDTRTGDYAGRA